MNKKYDCNLQEIKETRTFATNNTSTFFTCDTCGRSVGGITIVNGMRFCAKCYQDTFKDYYGTNWQALAELKQQLTEKDKEIRELKEELEDETDFKNEYYVYWQDCKKEIEELKKALELACETIRSMMPDKPLWICGDALAKKYNIPNTPTIKDFDYFIQKAQEELCLNNNKKNSSGNTTKA